VLVALLLLPLGLRPPRGLARGATAGLAGIAALALSYPAVFVLASVAGLAALDALGRRDREGLRDLAVAAACWLAGFAALWAVRERYQPSPAGLDAFWADAFAPLPLSIDALRWYGKAFLGWVYIGFREMEMAGPYVLDAWFGPANLVWAGAVLAGFVALGRACPRLLALVALTVLPLLAASALGFYPCSSRLILFLVPLLMLAGGGLVEWVERSPWAGPRASAAMAALLLAVAGAGALRFVPAPTVHSDLGRALDFVVEHRGEADLLALDSSHGAALVYYASHDRRLGLVDAKVLFDFLPEDHPGRLARRFCRERGGGHLWIVVDTRDWAAAQIALTDELRELGAERAAWSGHAMRAHRFELDARVCEALGVPPGA
jgi:hypothetical protein